MTTRRDFLKQMGVAAAGLGIAPISSFAAGHSNNITAPKGDKVKIAFIGIGNRGEQDVDEFARTGMIDVVALCDVDLDGKQT